MTTIKTCAACGKKSPVGAMKTCMHNQMHNYVCDSKCMSDFYNPPKKPAPSLPAAGSADQPYPEGIAEDLERSDWTPIEALQWYATGKHFDVVGGRTRIIDTGAVASNALKHASLAYLELKGDAELSELRAALSAQQSAPERVSVPVELAERLINPYRREPRSIHLHNGDCAELRALLASHGRGEA